MLGLRASEMACPTVEALATVSGNITCTFSGKDDKPARVPAWTAVLCTATSPAALYGCPRMDTATMPMQSWEFGRAALQDRRRGCLSSRL